MTEWVLFGAFGLMSVVGATMVVTARDPFISALSLIVNFVGLGAMYLVLHAPFVAAAQIIVYAGAVVVLFLFVLAYLGADRERMSAVRRSPWTRPVGILTGVALMVSFIVTLQLTDADLIGRGGEVGDEFGSATQIGEAFLTTYVLQFEMTSLVLLVAAVGGVVLGLTGRERHSRLRRELSTRSADEFKRLDIGQLRAQRATEREQRLHGEAGSTPVVGAGDEA